MLSRTAQKFVFALAIPTHKDSDGQHLEPSYTISYGNYSDQPIDGLRRQHATLLQNGKYVASYDATRDEVY